MRQPLRLPSSQGPFLGCPVSVLAHPLFSRTMAGAGAAADRCTKPGAPLQTLHGILALMS